MDSDKRKRLTIPIVTLIVGIVMMSGVGYAALTSTFEVTENSTVGAELVVKIENEDLVGGKILKDVKIPYAVNTTNGVKSYHVEHGHIVLKTVPITAADGMNHGKYNIKAEITPSEIDGTNGDKILIMGVIRQGGTPTSVITGFGDLWLDIVLLVGGSFEFDDPSILKINNISIKITLSYAEA